MEGENLKSFLKAYLFVHKFLLWSKTQRLHSRSPVDKSAVVDQINFVLLCIEYMYHYTPEISLADEAAIELALLTEALGIEDQWDSSLARLVKEAAERGAEDPGKLA